MFNERFEKIIMILILALAIFILGVQFGIHQGINLQRQEYYEFILAN